MSADNPRQGLLVPKIIGPERVEISESEGCRAFSGTGFDPDNVQHMLGSDGLRYAIALQQMRDMKLFDELDTARSLVEKYGYFVMQERGATCVLSKPPMWGHYTARQRKKMKPCIRMPISDEVIFDTLQSRRDLMP